MVNPSNLYAEKIFSEHPVAMWSFDDNIKYNSVITDSQRLLSGDWTFSAFGGLTVSASSYDTTEMGIYPKLGSLSTAVSTSPTTSSGTFYANSDFTITTAEDTFSVGMYIFKLTPYLTSIKIAYVLGSTSYGSSTIPVDKLYEWDFVSATFATQVTNATIEITFNYSAPSTIDSVDFFVNGLTVGSFAEDSNLVDLGSQAETLPANLAISPSFTKGIPVSRYNSASDFGYVITKDGKSYGRNTSFPMTYGSENVLVLSPNETDTPYAAPSLIVPSHGFLNESEKYKTKTFEAWIRVKAQTTEPKRIIGPISGTDGLYVDGAYLILSVGKEFGSFYVGEWDRPMLIHIVTSINSAKLFLNGDLVISLAYDTDELNLEPYYFYNGIINSTFESNTTGWGVRNGSQSRSSADKYTGTYSSLFTVGSSGTSAGINVSATTTYLPSVTAGKKYTYSIYLKDVDTSKSYRSFIDWYDSSATYLGSGVSGSITSISTSSWTRVSITATAPEGAAYARPYTYSSTSFSSGDAGKQLYFDAALFQEGTNSNAFLPANSTYTQDWIGFYAYSDVPRLEVDCVAIYAYEVDNVLALRRFVYAQGIDFPTALISSNGGEVLIPDYSVSNYTNNYTYGDSQKLPFSNADVMNNIDILGQRIKAPKYKLPQIRIEPDSTKTPATMLYEQQGSDYLDLQPTSAWNDIESHIYFDKLSQTQDSTKAFYIVATRSEANASKQILFKVFNKIDGNYLEAYTITSGGNNNIVYDFSFNGTTSTLATVSGNVAGTKFGAGINIDALVAANTTLGSNIETFFSNQDSLAVYVGGDELFTTDTTFTGNIYKFGFTNARNLSKISSLFTDGRFSGSATTLDSHTATYTLITKSVAGNLVLDIATNMYWQESIPLASLGKFIEGQSLLDYLQVNLDYPKPITFSSDEYNTDSSAVRLYLTFQDSLDTPSDILAFNNIVRVDRENVIEDTTGYETTAYEMVDGTVIYIPSISVDSYLAVVHSEINVDGIITNPLSLKNIQIASQALSLDPDAPTEIGTKLGPSLVGYGATSSENNPIILPKENDNHLYLSGNSGMMIAGTASSSRGHYININAGESSEFDIGIIQATMKFPLSSFSTSDVLIFEVLLEDATAIKFYIDSINSSNNRAKVFAKDETGTAYTSLEYFINGIKTEYPVISLDEWVTIGIRFTEHFSIASQTAKIKICGPMLLNNLFYSQLKAGDEASTILTTDIWANVLYNGNTKEIWDDYDGGNWSAVYTVTASATEINGLEIQDVYESFVGTQKVIAFYDETSTKLKTKSYQYVAYIGSQSDTITSTPL
jgi:hypothetical protein